MTLPRPLVNAILLAAIVAGVLAGIVLYAGMTGV